MRSLVLFVTVIHAIQCQTDLSSSTNSFSLELLHFTAQQTNGHVVLSPFGVWTLMTGVGLGATGNSGNQLRKAFFLPANPSEIIKGYGDLTQAVLNPTSKDVTLVSNNFMFLDQDFPIYPEFSNVMQEKFGADIKVMDFKDSDTAATIANNHIQSSGGKVANVLTSDDFSNSRMILTNVISFKGLWTLPFNTTDTNIEPFYDENKVEIGKVNMMFQQSPFSLSRIAELKGFALELPYGKDEKYSMLIIKPYPGETISKLYRNFPKITLKQIIEQLERDSNTYGKEDVEVRIPRFKIDTNVVLNKPLNDMGVYDIFVPQLAKFDRVSKESLFVSAIVHKAEIEVTESGTVASAATTATFADRISTPTFVANSPFLYFVVEKKTATVIFSGIYSQPTVY